jgi:hypothetical protein
MYVATAYGVGELRSYGVWRNSFHLTVIFVAMYKGARVIVIELIVLSYYLELRSTIVVVVNR